MNVDVVSVVKFEYSTKCYQRPHYHNSYELLIYLHGKGKTTIDGKEFDFSPNSVILISPRTIHDSSVDDGGAEVMCINFSCNDLIYNIPLPVINVPDTTEIFTCAKAIFNETNTRGKFYKKKASLYLENIIIELARLSYNSANTKYDELQPVYNYICNNYGTKIDFKALASKVGFSYDYFRHIFQEKFGISPQRLLIEQRFHAAKQMLEGTNDSITDIAISSGFSSSSQFSRMFRQKYGVSPRDYRIKQMEKEHSGIYVQ